MALNVAAGTLGDLAPAAGAFPNHHAYYVKEWVEIANPDLVFDMFGTPKPIPKNSSNEMVFSRMLKMPTSGQTGLIDSPLVEGVTPTEQTFQMVRFNHTVNQYGGFARTSDKLHEESINGITSMYNTRLAEQGAEVMNLVVRNDLSGGSNVRFAAPATSRNTITASGIAAADFDYVYKAFKLEKVKPMSPMTKGSPNTGTTPIREAYPVLVPIEAIPFIEALDDGNGHTFKGVETYAGQIGAWPNEHGSYKHFRFILNTEVEIASNGAGTPQDIAVCLCFGKGAYHVTSIGMSDVELIVKPLGSSGTLDPLNQRSSIGWKAKKGAVIAQPTYMFRIEFSLGDT